MSSSILPISFRQRFSAFERTKAYDFFAASPVIAWWCYSLWKQWPRLNYSIADSGLDGETLGYLRAIAEAGVFCFVLAAVILLIVRVPPIAKSSGILPRIAGFVGTFSTSAYLGLPSAEIGYVAQITATTLVCVGSIAGIWCILSLGRSFSLAPEARVLKTRGVYRFIRHPLYLAELLTVAGAAIQFVQPWSALIAFGTLALQLYRIENEERVLQATFKEYAAYADRTDKIIPFLY